MIDKFKSYTRKEMSEIVSDILLDLKDDGYLGSVNMNVDYFTHLFVRITDYEHKSILLYSKEWDEIMGIIGRIIKMTEDEFIPTTFYYKIQNNKSGDSRIFNRGNREMETYNDFIAKDWKELYPNPICHFLSLEFRSKNA
jgi:hypothetical protein